MKKALLAVFLASIQSTLLISPSRAQVSQSNRCSITLNTVKSRIETGRDATISSFQQLDAANGHPRNRPVMLQLRVDGSSAASIMNSPQFMRSISTDIINSCPNVSAVQFNLNHTGWTEVFGLIGETVESFECYDYDLSYPGWGYQPCGL